MIMAVTHQNQPHEAQINEQGQSGQPTIATGTNTGSNTMSKRQRRPSVRLVEIGDQPAALVATTTASQSRSRNSGEGEKGSNLDNVAIGSWKFKGCMTKKRPRTNWVSPKVDDSDVDGVGGDGFSRDFEMEGGESPSKERDPGCDFVGNGGDSSNLEFRGVDNGDGDDDGVELDDDGDDGNKNSGRVWGREDDGVKVWLNELGLGRYWPVFEIHEVDEEVLPLLTLEDLKDMGISAVGSRRKLFCAIQKLDKEFS